MFLSYLKTALRNLWRNRLHSSINLLGLTLGISCCFILWLYIQSEWQYDMVYPNSKRIYRVIEEYQTPEQGKKQLGRTSTALAPALQANFPTIEEAAFFLANGSSVVKIGSKKINDRDFRAVSPNVLKVFGWKLLRGDPNTALSAPQSAVLTKKTALKWFGTLDVIDKTFEFNRTRGKVRITGLLDDLPHNTHIQFSMLLSLPKTKGWEKFLGRWSNRAGYTYLLLKDPGQAQKIAQQLPTFVAKKGGKGWQNRTVRLQALSQAHFYSNDISSGMNDETKGNLFYLYAFIVVAIFLLVIASINYVNLTTAKSVYRAREIGVRKVMGAYRKQLIFQFLLESSLIALLAFIISVGVTEAVLPYFNDLAGKNFSIGWGNALSKLLHMFMITIGVGLLAGIYPALVLSGYQPVFVLKSQVKTSPKGLLLRRSLVVSQFALSALMIIATLTIRRQLHYVQNKEMGFDKKQMMVIDINSSKVRRSFKAIKHELLKHPSITQVSTTSRVPGDWKNIAQLPVVRRGQNKTEAQEAFVLGADKDFLSTFNIQLIQGENFAGKDQSDSLKVLLNQVAARQLGVETGDYVQSTDTTQKFIAKVKGIVKDFHLQSLHNKISPVIIAYWNNPIATPDYITAKVNSQNIPALIAHAKKVNDQFDSDTPVELHFLDDQMQQFYYKEALTGQIFNIAAFITILIASMGLFGLATFTIQKRTKEIAIRKVLGASSIQLFTLLSKGYIKQISLSLLFAFPVGYYLMNYWLKDFAYRISIGVTVFIWAATAAALVTFLTIGYQTIIAARYNPVDSLRNE